MVVYEIKDPAAAVVSNARPKPLRPDLTSTSAIQHGHAIDQLLGRREQGKGQEGRERRRLIETDQPSVREISRLVEQINHQLEAQGIMIHLVLVTTEGGFAIDLYDCSDGNVCRNIHDIRIGIGDLSILFARLTLKTGIMVDKVL